MSDPAIRSLLALKEAENACTRCALYRNATQAVPGEGQRNAPLMFVGEQPGNDEDLAGRPFIGPAGRVLDRAIADAGLERKQIFVTNAVKHFKYQQRGKRRLHAKPTAGEVQRYRWWLFQELSLVHPRLTVALGATAAQALTGKTVSIGRARGDARFGNLRGYITVHPSYLLRIPDEPSKRRAYAEFRTDLERIRALAA